MKPARFGLAALAAFATLALPAVAQANEVTKWNEIAVSTVLAQPPVASGPPASAQLLAMVQGAVYGAVNSIDRQGKPYLVERAYPLGSLDAAVATAAFRVLDATFPAMHTSLQAQYDASLAAVPDSSSKETGVQAGGAAADAMLAGGHFAATAVPCLFGSGSPGGWQPLLGPAGPLCDPNAWVANAVPFVVRSTTQFRTAGPGALTSAQYAADLNEVKSLGAIDSTTRDPEQTHLAVFWQTNPTAAYNALARRLADEHSLDVTQTATLFALSDLSAADSIMNCWSDKYAWRFWRPMAAIRNADVDGNPDTEADKTWTPLFDPSLPASTGGIGPALITPPFPDQPSGHNCYTAAIMHAFESFFGTDELTFYVTSSRFPGEQLYFHRFSDVIAQMIEARIWAGIHFRTADVAGANLGSEVEDYVHTHQFAFVH